MNLWKIATVALALMGALIVGGIVVMALAMSGVSPQLAEKVDSYVSLGQPARPSEPPGSMGPGGRLVIPSIDVDARMVILGKDDFGALETPDNGWDVGWYDFSTVPGQPGNSVMTGHVDYYDVGPAVFSRLRDLDPGDGVQIQLPDGYGVVDYEVTSVDSYDAGTAPADDIMGPADDDVLTLITCDGWFDPTIREYDHRLIVRAEPVS